MYELIIVAGLVIAVLTNLYSTKALVLCFVAVAFLLIIPQLIPINTQESSSLFPLLCLFEIAFGFFALLTKAPVGKFIAGVCVYNVLCHLAGWYTYENSIPLYDSYSFWLRVGESVQVLALILGSKLATAIIISAHMRYIEKENHNGHRLVAGGS